MQRFVIRNLVTQQKGYVKVGYVGLYKLAAGTAGTDAAAGGGTTTAGTRLKLVLVMSHQSLEPDRIIMTPYHPSLAGMTHATDCQLSSRGNDQSTCTAELYAR